MKYAGYNFIVIFSADCGLPETEQLFFICSLSTASPDSWPRPVPFIISGGMIHHLP
jgi:hypothetical protein